MINWKVDGAELETIGKIAERAVVMARTLGSHITKQAIVMDLIATHKNGNPLRLLDLLQADDYNFSHDVFGIYRHIDRSTGKLGDCFSPRFSATKKAAKAVR